MVADTLKLLPRESETTRRWSAASWARDRRGWLFLTSTPETRTRLVPLTSLWLDMLVLRLMNRGQPGHRPVWFVLDELASLQRLPQLHTAVTENRKSNNPVVLGFQGRSQLETRYGHDAEAMLSQPATKIFLRTSEPHAAKWISDTIGEVEIERLRESRSKGKQAQRSYGLERQVEPLVMPSEISGLPSLRGYLKLENLIVRLHFPFLDLPARHPAFIERPATKTTRPTVAAAPPVRPAAPVVQSAVPEALIAHEQPTSTPVAQQPFFQQSTPMLTISKPLSAGQARRYHAEEFQNARENYYTEGDQIRGLWYGHLAVEPRRRGPRRPVPAARRGSASDHRRTIGSPSNRP